MSFAFRKPAKGIAAKKNLRYGADKDADGDEVAAEATGAGDESASLEEPSVVKRRDKTSSAKKDYKTRTKISFGADEEVNKRFIW